MAVANKIMIVDDDPCPIRSPAPKDGERRLCGVLSIQ